MNTDLRRHTDNRTPDINLHTEIPIIQETILTKGIGIHLPGQATIVSKDTDHQLLPNIQATNRELTAAQNTHPGQVCFVKNAAHSETTTNTLAQPITTTVPINVPNAGKVIITHPNVRQNEDRPHRSQTINH